MAYGDNMSSKLIKKESKDSIPVSGFDNIKSNMYEHNKMNVQKAPGQEEYEYEIDADFDFEQTKKDKPLSLGGHKMSNDEGSKVQAFTHVLVQNDERSPSLSPKNDKDKQKYNPILEAQRKSRKTDKFGGDQPYNIFGAGSTGDTGGMELENKHYREEEKSASMAKKSKKATKKTTTKGKVNQKQSDKDFQILMQSK